jgi:cell division transport system ATP-binding protein
MALITLDHVSKIYPKGTRPALDDITVHIDRGDFVFLVGASGSGKTTLLSLLLHEEEATDGEIRVAGNDLRRLSNRQVPQYRRSIGFVFQDFKLLNNKTVWQNVAFALEVIGMNRSTIHSLVPKVLETVGLTGKERNYPHELSGGEAQRVAIARAYVNHPQLLLADEPTGNLDPTTSLGIMEVLDAINRTGTTVVMATHNEEIVNSMRKRVVELHNGKMVRDQMQGSYDSALFFPDAEVESKSKAQHVADGSQQLGRSVDDEAGHGAAGHDAAQIADARGGAVQSIEMHSVEMHSAAASAVGSGAASAAPEGNADLMHAMDAVVEAMQTDTGEDAGIARLAMSMHSGRKGRYGEAFKPVETTMTWGRGIAAESIAAAGGAAQVGAGAQEPPQEKRRDGSALDDEATETAPPAPPAPPVPSRRDGDLQQHGDGAAAQYDEDTPQRDEGTAQQDVETTQTGLGASSEQSENAGSEANSDEGDAR